MTIDLHGYTENEALGQIATALLDLEYDQVDEVIFITGKGEVLRDVVIEEVEKMDFHWSFDGSNTGSIIVKN